MDDGLGKAWKSVVRRLGTLSLLFLAVLGFVGVGIGFHLQASAPLEAGLFFGVGTSLLATVVTSGLNDWITREAQLSAIQHSIATNVRDVLSVVQKETYSLIAAEFPRFIPASFFPATKGRNAEFEQEMRKAISESRQYFFRGVTGRHVPIWLETAETHNLHVTALLLQPRNKDFITLYVKDRLGVNKQLTSAQIDKAVSEVVEEIYSAVVALFDSRHLCPITIKMHNGPVFFRSEMFDSSCFVSFYIDSTGTNYPGTYVYNKDSLFYASFRKDINDCMRLATDELRLNSNSVEGDLKRFLESIGYAGEIEPLRRSFSEFRAKFLADP